MEQRGSRADRWERARARAVALGDRPLPLDHRLWAVASATGREEYQVTGLDEHGLVYRCDCAAGRFDTPCHHAASVADLPDERARRARYRAGIRTLPRRAAPVADFAAWLAGEAG